MSGLDDFFLNLPQDELSKAKNQIGSDYVELLGPYPKVFDLTQYPLTRPRSLLTGEGASRLSLRDAGFSALIVIVFSTVTRLWLLRGGLCTGTCTDTHER